MISATSVKTSVELQTKQKHKTKLKNKKQQTPLKQKHQMVQSYHSSVYRTQLIHVSTLYKDIHKPIFVMVLLLITAMIWNWPRRASIDERVKKMWQIVTVRFYSGKRRNRITLFVGEGGGTGGHHSSRMSLTREDKHNGL